MALVLQAVGSDDVAQKESREAGSSLEFRRLRMSDELLDPRLRLESEALYPSIGQSPFTYRSI